MTLSTLRLKKNEDRRIRAGHVWIYSNEIDSAATPLKNFSAGQEVLVIAHDKTPLGVAYVNPHSLISARLFTRNPKEQLDENLLVSRIKTALTWRERLFSKSFYRLVFGESDGLPGVIIDRFANDFVMQINTAGMEAKKDLLCSALQTAIPTVNSILLRNDSGIRQYENLETYVAAGLGSPPKKIQLEENDAIFYAPLWEGQKTGWFYDHRLNRSRLPNYVVNRRVLDVFSYLGAWGIQAAKFGAKEIYCVDSSAFATALIEENAKLNHVAEKTKILCEDAFVALKNLHQAKEKFDVIILDPPAFIKKQKDSKEGSLAYQRINEAALKLLSPGGILISCSCSMHFQYDDLVQSIRRAGLNTNSLLQMVERGHQAPDHPVHLAIPETDYLKMVIVRNIHSP